MHQAVCQERSQRSFIHIVIRIGGAKRCRIFAETARRVRVQTAHRLPVRCRQPRSSVHRLAQPRGRASGPGVYLAGERPLCISGGGHADGTRVVRPAREPAESAAGALRRPGAMMATGAADQLWAGRWCPVAARAAEPGKQIDVVSNQDGVAAGTWTRRQTAGAVDE